MWQRLSDRWRFRTAVQAAAPGPEALEPGDRDVVLIPCWRRPEFLWHCLDNLARTRTIDELDILIRPDTGQSTENLEVIRSFAERLPHLRIDYPVPCPYRRTKQSANVLLGYLAAAVAARRFVYLIEEDIMVARDFFLWHRAVHESAGNLFCSIAVKNPNRRHELAGNPEGYYLNSGDYCSYGVCFERSVLLQIVAPHINLGYFRRPKPYMRRHFPSSNVSLGYVEQDGLLRRIQEESRLPIAYPSLPRAYDAGFYGYNRPGGVEGALQERIARLGEIIYAPERIRGLVAPEFSEQCVAINLEPPAWNTQRELSVG